jgi:hypothetical protein
MNLRKARNPHPGQVVIDAQSPKVKKRSRAEVQQEKQANAEAKALKASQRDHDLKRAAEIENRILADEAARTSGSGRPKPQRASSWAKKLKDTSPLALLDSDDVDWLFLRNSKGVKATDEGTSLNTIPAL